MHIVVNAAHTDRHQTLQSENSKMPSKLEYTLIYFNGRGLAELPRLLFKYAEVDFVDTRMSGREEFVEKYKPVLPTGKVPVLEVKDAESGKVRKFPESAAIVRYLAREFGLYGKDNLEAFQIDVVLEVMNELKKPMFALFSENDEAKKAELQKKAREEELPPIMKTLEGLVAGETVFVGSSITVADFALFRSMELAMDRINCPTLLDDYPKLKAISDKVAKEPKIADWLAKRPVTPW